MMEFKNIELKKVYCDSKTIHVPAASTKDNELAAAISTLIIECLEKRIDGFEGHIKIDDIDRTVYFNFCMGVKHD